ncbi:uncharacterized protein LOC114532917 [Dendronephthya gigantea]|uniref:uncharacterized protein LOC114532917 n=1 Tax=Dendronephthya gigantea TaxID=151771 RepID=UPI00106DCCE8|nr:uncharacterized protein LOC114532917 [Dendronephthya gigantea]
MFSPVIVTAIFLAVFPASIRGHGMMMDPVNRASRWRKGYGGPREYTDNELWCGGRNVQWGKHKGKCGICGDEYGIANPKFQYPGPFAKNAPIVRSYQEGQQIQVKIKITANHLGSFKFRVAPMTQQPITQSDLNKILLRMPDGKSEWKLPPGSGVYTITLQLPRGLTCEHCVMQWWWSTANNWVNDKPESFVNCADIAILPRGGKPRPTAKPRPTRPPKPTRRPRPTMRPRPTRPTRPTRPAGKNCHALPNDPRPAMDNWCRLNCARGYCPASLCICD